MSPTCGGHGFDPWSGKIPHAAEQPSLCAPTIEPVLESPRAAATESCQPPPPHSEKPTHSMKGSSQLTAAGGEPSSNEGPVQLKIVFKKHPGVCDQLLALLAGVLAQQKDCFKGMKTEEKSLQIAMGLPKETDTSQEHHRFAPASLLVSLTPNHHLGEQWWTTSPHGYKATCSWAPVGQRPDLVFL